MSDASDSTPSAPAPRAVPAEAEAEAIDAGAILSLARSLGFRGRTDPEATRAAGYLRALLAAWRAASRWAGESNDSTNTVMGWWQEAKAEAEGLRARVAEMEAAEEHKAVLRCATDLLRLVVRDYLGGMRGDDFDETIELARRMVESDDFKRAAGLGPAPREGD
jgi:hypothetical protein